jgi:hypothetical protein
MRVTSGLARWLGLASVVATCLPIVQAAPWNAAGDGHRSIFGRHLSPPASHKVRHEQVQEREASSNSSSSTGRLVFCHFMIGIVSDRTTAGDYDDDMQRAKSLGIDAFALNIGVDPYTDAQLQLAYQSAANNGMKVFISFDFNWFTTSQASKVGQMIGQYGKLSAQLMVDGKIFASSFAGDGVSVSDIRAAAGADIFFAPNFHPELSADSSSIDAALNWMAWPNNGNNKAPDGRGNVTVQAGDAAYQKWLGAKPYIAPVSPWFSTHFGPEVSYSKNWVFPSDLLWFSRWVDILTMGPRFIEIITWNDYGESHYIGPLDSTHTDDGNSKWVNDMPHDGWLDMAKPFMAAFHAGDATVDAHIKEDQLVYWYRPTLRSLDCDATDTTVGVGNANNASGNFFEGRPNGWEDMEDAVFVVTLLTQKASVTVTSGSKTQTFDAPAGAFATMVPMALGKQSYSVSRGGSVVLSGTSLRDISDSCSCGIYNFNAYVGMLPSKAWKGLGTDGLQALTSGLHVSTCKPTPSITYAVDGSGVVGNATAAPGPITTATGIVTTSMAGAPSGTGIVTTTTVAASTKVGTQTGGASTKASTQVGGASSKISSPSPVKPTATSVLSLPTTLVATTVPATATASAGSGSGSGTCNAGTQVAGPNFAGLCAFACARGYCPTSVCACTSYGTPLVATDTGITGCPLPGLGASYLGLCAFGCPRGYCPSEACTTAC